MRISRFAAVLAAVITSLLLIGSSGRCEPAQEAAAEQPAAPHLPASVRVPILIYHHIRPGPLPASHALRLLTTNPEAFENDLGYLRDNGYRTISFEDLANHLEQGAALPERPAIISFDDGWEQQFTYAVPLLSKYNFTATFFIVTNYVGHPNFLSLAQLKGMLAGGMEIGSHSRSHPSLPGLGRARQWDEIARSKTLLETWLGTRIVAFAYPYGAYDEPVAEMTTAAGYRAARTVDDGTLHTRDDLNSLAGLTFPAYLRSYRGGIALTAATSGR